MRRYLLLFAFTAAIISWTLTVPKIQYIGNVNVQAVQTNVHNIQSSVNCDGSIFSNTQQNISFGYAVKVSKVYVKVGDTVKPGQKLMDLDKDQTVEAFINSVSSHDNSASGNSDSNSEQDTAYESSSSQNTDSSVSIPGLTSSQINGLISKYGQYMQNNYSTSSSASGIPSTTSSSSLSSLDSVPESIYSTISGTVTALNAQEGNFTAAQNTIMTISDLSTLEVTAKVNEGIVSSVKVGQNASIAGQAFEKTYQGIVKQVYPVADTNSSLTSVNTPSATVNIVISIKNPDSDLKPGYDTSVNILTGKSWNGISVPYEAVMQDESNQEYVFIVNSGRAYRKNIKTGNETSKNVEITSGLKSGDIVILNPLSSLKNGQLVNAKLENCKNV